MRRNAVTWAIRERSYSQRRACRLVGLHAKTYRYTSRRPDDDAVRVRLKELASQRRRFGYRRLGLLLGREGIRLNRKKLYRLYKEERLTVSRFVLHGCPRDRFGEVPRCSGRARLRAGDPQKETDQVRRRRRHRVGGAEFLLHGDTAVPG